MSAHAANLDAIKAQAKKAGYSDLYLDGVSLFIQEAMKGDISHQKPVIRYNPKLDDAFVMVQVISGKWLLYRHRPVMLDLPIIDRLNAQLASVFVLTPIPKGRQVFTGEPLGRLVGRDGFMAYKGTHELENVTGAHVSALILKPVRLSP